MSLINTTMNLSSSGMNTDFIKYMKYAGAFVRPKDMTRYSYRPYLVEKVVLGMSSSLILI
jgi:negative regulator of sigma E activity